MRGICSSLNSLRWAPCRAQRDLWAVGSSQTSGGLFFFAHVKRDPHSSEHDLFLISLFSESQASGLGRTKELLVLMSHNTYYNGAQLVTLPKPVYLPLHLQQVHIHHHHPLPSPHTRKGQEGGGHDLDRP